MRCQHAQLLISKRLDGEIAPADQAGLEAHLRDCRGCRAFAADLSALPALLGTVSGGSFRGGFTGRLLESLPPAKVAARRILSLRAARMVHVAAGVAAFFGGLTFSAWMETNGNGSAISRDASEPRVQESPESLSNAAPEIEFVASLLGVEGQG